MIHSADKELKQSWQERFDELPEASRDALRDALLELRRDALSRASLQWRRHKAPMALYWKVVGVYAGHLARAVRKRVSDGSEKPGAGNPARTCSGRSDGSNAAGTPNTPTT